MTHKFIYAILVSFILAGCQTSGKNEMTEAKEEIPVPSPSEIAIEDLIADYDTIRLEATSHSLLSDIRLVRIMNNKLYVTDDSQALVFIFSMQGKYISKICNQGEGPEEYIKITSFETDPVNNRLLISDNFSKRLFEYDEYGKLLKTISLDFNPTLITSDQSKRYIHLNSAFQKVFQNPEMEDNNVHIINNEGKVTKTFLKDETPNRMDLGSSCSSSYADNGELLYMPALSNTIYRIHESEAIPEYVLSNLSDRKNLTTKEKQDIFYRYDQNNLEKYEKDGFLISYGSFLRSDSLIYLSFGWNVNWRTFYSPAKKCSFTIDREKLKENKGLCEVFFGYPQAISGNTLYMGIPFGKINNVLPMLPEGKLKSFFEGMKEEDNPCIIAYRINKNIFN